MSNNQQQIVVFHDLVGRTVLANLKSKDKGDLNVENPVVLNVVPGENGRMTVQLFPLFFREFLADKSEKVTFTFKEGNYTPTDITALDFRLLAQYNQMFSAEAVLTPSPQSQDKSSTVVNLFEE